MIRAVIFDVGGVLIRTEDRAPRRALERHLGLAPGEAEELVFGEPMGTRAQLGEIPAATLWGWVQRKLALDADGLAAFYEQFYGGDRLDQDLVDLIRHLRPRYQTAIISNAMDDLRDVVTTLYPMADAFDLVVGSAYEGMMKPDARIFERTLSRLDVAPHEAVFVDDMLPNIEAARAFGMVGIHYQPGLDVGAELRLLGVQLTEDDEVDDADSTDEDRTDADSTDQDRL
ncbi:MAG: HAD family phosphatase [Litorilinea sp.]